MATANAMFTITDVGDLNGRNLIQRSFFTKEPWTGPKNVVSDGFGVYHDKECLPVYTSYIRENTNAGKETAYPDLVFEENTQYTISGKWAQFRTDSKFNVLWIIFRYSDGTFTSIKQPSVNNEWRDFKLTSEAGKTVVAITHTYSNTGYTFLADYKLEVGTEATDWTPAPEDVNAAYLDAKTANETADYAKTEIDGLEIGGRNLILNGDEEHSRTVPSTGSTVYISNYTFSAYGVPYAHTESEEMTVSFNFEATGNELDTGRIYLQLTNTAISSSNTSHYLIDAPSGKYVRTFKVTAAQAAHSGNYVRVPVIGCSPGTVVKVWNMKVELGNRATDWTPAPEDVEEAINSKNSVYYQATAPTGNLKDGDTWFDTDNDYKISRWDGSTWAAAELGDSAVANLSASKLIAGSVMGNIVLGGTIQAGGSDVGQDGKVLVKDASDVEVASLSKDGLVATAGTIGGWTIDESSLNLSVPYTYDNSGDQVIAHGDDTDLIQVEDAQLVGGSEDDDADISLLTLGRDQSDGMPYILCDDGTLDGSQVRIKNGKISCLKNDNTLTNGISTYIQSDAVLLSESFVINDITKVNNVRLKSDKVEVLYTPDYEHRTSETIERAILTYNDLVFSGDSYQPALASGIVHWSIFSFQRTIKDTLNVTVYHCGNLFWAHFDGAIPAGWTAANTQNVFIPIYNETVLSTSVKVAPPKNVTKYIIPTDLENMRISVTVRSDGQLGISRVAEPFKGNATTTIAGYMETCDIFWAHIG